MARKMGYERVLYYGAAGSQAATQLTRARDVQYENGTSTGEVTAGGDGSAPPIEYHRVATRTAKVTFNMINDTGDTALTALIAAARGGTAVAIYVKDYSGGKGFDGDMILTVTHGAPYKGEQTFDFEGTPTYETREATLNAS
jgi:hypothetical protein